MQILRPADRVSAINNRVNQLGNRLVHHLVTIARRRVFVCRSGILQDSHDLFLRNNVEVIQSQHQGLTNRQGRISGDVIGDWHCVQLSNGVEPSYRVAGTSMVTDQDQTKLMWSNS